VAAARFRNRDNLFILLVYAGIYSTANVAFFICDRYRYPVWPALAGAGRRRAAGWPRNDSPASVARVAMGFGVRGSDGRYFPAQLVGVKLPNFAQGLLFPFQRVV